MASGIEQSLTDGEQIIYQARLSLWSQFGTILLGLILLPVLGLGLLFLGQVWLRYRTTQLAITNKRIISKRGILNHSTMELRLDKIESLKIEQPLLGRMLNYGSVILAGTGGDKTPIEHIRAPAEFQRQFIVATDRGGR